MNYWLQFQNLYSQKIFLKKEIRSQLAKDLQLELKDVPEENLASWLENWLIQNLEKLDLANLLYRVDIEPRAMQNPHILTIAILEREAQKVIFRAQYSGRL